MKLFTILFALSLAGCAAVGEIYTTAYGPICEGMGFQQGTVQMSECIARFARTNY